MARCETGGSTGVLRVLYQALPGCWLTQTSVCEGKVASSSKHHQWLREGVKAKERSEDEKGGEDGRALAALAAPPGMITRNLKWCQE